MRLIYIAFAISFIGLFSCNNNAAPAANNTSGSAQQPKAAPVPAQSKLGDAGTHTLMDVVSRYYTLKNALVATKASRADSAAADLVAGAATLQSMLQKDSANVTALKPYLDTIIAESRQIQGLNDESCERQRLAFGPLSSAMFGLLKNVELKHAGIYREFCPMAFNEKGAYWLSDESEIKNPYFGKKMIECGEVTDSL